jgi:outer membrane protein
MRHLKLCIFQLVFLSSLFVFSIRSFALELNPEEIGTSEITLSNAVKTALEKNPEMQLVKYEYEFARASSIDAKYNLLPQLNFTEDFTYTNNSAAAFAAIINQSGLSAADMSPDFLNDPDFKTNFRSALNLKVPIFNKWRVFGAISQTSSLKKQMKDKIDFVSQKIILDVIRAYYATELAYSKKRILDKAIELSEAEVKRLDDLHLSGQIVASDLLAMKVQLADYQQQAIQAYGDIQSAYAELNMVMGLKIDDQFITVDRLKDIDFSIEERPKLLEIALMSRSDYRQVLEAIEYQEKSLDVEKGDFLPELNLLGSLGHNTDFDDARMDVTLGANLTLDLLDATKFSKIKKAKAKLLQVQAEKMILENQLKLEVVRAYHNYLAAKDRLKVSKIAIEQAQETLRIVHDRFEAGLTTITELLRSQTALVRIELDMLKSLYDYYTGYANVLFSTGKLNGVESFYE